MKKKTGVIIAILLALVIISATAFAVVLNKRSKSEKFDENNVVLTFSAMSDIHQQMGKTDYSQKLINALDYSKQLNGGKHLDLALFAGDLTEETWRQKNEKYNENYNGDIQMLKETLSSALDIQKTAVFYCLGNHDTDPKELGSEYTSKMPELFYNQLGEEFFAFDSQDSLPKLGLRHLQIKGYHFFAVQPDTYWTLRGYSSSTLDWLDAKLSKVTAENPNQYVFVTAHPPIYGTVFGSYANTWADNDLAKILQKYPQVIYFSGHIHNVLQDEMQISQNKSFTAVDCGSVKYTEIMNDINDSRTNSFDNGIGTRIEDFSQGLFVQVDKNGNVRITRCDYYNRRTIKSAWELTAPQKGNSHLNAYDNDARIQNNIAPAFGADAFFTLEKTQEGVTFNWSSATDDDMVRYYYIVLYGVNGSTKAKLKEFNVATFTYRYSSSDQMPKTMQFSASGQYSGELYAEIFAVDIWGKKSLPVSSIQL